MYVVICKIDHCIHIHWCIVMGLGHNDPWVESHMDLNRNGVKGHLGVNDLWFKFWKKVWIHILWCIFKSNITMIAKVCDRESKRDSRFENRLVLLATKWTKNGVFVGGLRGRGSSMIVTPGLVKPCSAGLGERMMFKKKKHFLGPKRSTF